jgi:hypothetical protein
MYGVGLFSLCLGIQSSGLLWLANMVSLYRSLDVAESLRTWHSQVDQIPSPKISCVVFITFIPILSQMNRFHGITLALCLFKT